ncbi:MAG: metallophosphoesterase family protein [Magnetococcales bacterium]|nr:metallophosphoesterase family protein [Magnetococcales bacterium]
MASPNPPHRQAWIQGRTQRENQLLASPGHGRRMRYRKLIHACKAPLTWLGIYQWGMANARKVHITSHTLPFATLPTSFQGYRILHLSDLHFGILAGFGKELARQLQNLEVDLVLFTGDLNHGPSPESPETPLETTLAETRCLLDVLNPRDGFVAVMGNHDRAAMWGPLEEMGVRVLVNESHTIKRHRDQIHLVGTDDVHRFDTPEAEAALVKAPSGFRIALVHSTGLADGAARAGFDLYLCGHNHGGQICLPGGIPLVGSRSRPYGRCASGFWQVGEMTGFTSRGAGVAYPPLRFNCPGEAVVLTLVGDQEGSH